MSQKSIFGRHFASGGQLNGVTFGAAVSELPWTEMPMRVESALNKLKADTHAWNLPFSDPRSTKGFFLLLKHYKLGTNGDYKNLYATEQYLSDLSESEVEDPQKWQLAINTLKEVMSDNNAILNIGLVEEIKTFLPDVVYRDLLDRAKDSEADTKLSDQDTPPPPADNEDPEQMKARLEQELLDLKELLEILDDKDEIAKIEQEIKDVTELLEIL